MPAKLKAGQAEGKKAMVLRLKELTTSEIINNKGETFLKGFAFWWSVKEKPFEKVSPLDDKKTSPFVI